MGGEDETQDGKRGAPAFPSHSRRRRRGGCCRRESSRGRAALRRGGGRRVGARKWLVKSLFHSMDPEKAPRILLFLPLPIVYLPPPHTAAPEKPHAFSSTQKYLASASPSSSAWRGLAAAAAAEAAEPPGGSGSPARLPAVSRDGRGADLGQQQPTSTLQARTLRPWGLGRCAGSRGGPGAAGYDYRHPRPLRGRRRGSPSHSDLLGSRGRPGRSSTVAGSSGGLHGGWLRSCRCLPSCC